MKNLLTKILFISLLLSAVMPLGVQAGLLLEQAVVMGQAITNAAVSGAAQEGREAIPIEAVALTAAGSVVIATVVTTVVTGDVGVALEVAGETAKAVGKGMALVAAAALTGKIVAAIKR